ncbi:MAG: hypothetical protein U5O39_11780 [Gammaproteobacteria bacterium]|nr:hypothetical protein [Gammaproteobacteria bacterium]
MPLAVIEQLVLERRYISRPVRSDGSGTFDIDVDTDLLAGSSLDVSAGSLNVAGGANLGFAGGNSLTLGDGTTLDGTGALDFFGSASTVTLAAPLTLTTSDPTFVVDAVDVTFTGGDRYALDMGRTFTLFRNEVIDVPLTNNGTLEACRQWQRDQRQYHPEYRRCNRSRSQMTLRQGISRLPTASPTTALFCSTPPVATSSR